MKHFERIEDHVDVSAMRAELDSQPEAWEEQVGRQERAAAQRETSGIPIRGLTRSKVRGRRRRDVHESRFTGLSRRFPQIVEFIEKFAAEQDATPARARIARLPPGQRVFPHADRGDYYRWHDRYHLVIESPQGSVLQAGGEEARMREGELWWFDNKAIHEASNETDAPRIHLIFDLRPRLPENLRSPAPAPTGLEEETRRPGALLRQARERVARHEAEVVQEAVRLYLAGRERPRRWSELLERKGFPPGGEDFRPLRATIAMIAPDTSEQAVIRQGRALVWALEKIETGELVWNEVADALVRAGGVKTVARAWKQQQDFE